MLCTIGDLIEDVVVWLNGELNIGSDTDSVIVRTRGGSAANVAMFGALTGTPSRFIGQVGNDVVEREAFQEIDYRRMFGQMAKWVAQIDRTDRIPEYIARAFSVATSGRQCSSYG